MTVPGALSGPLDRDATGGQRSGIAPVVVPERRGHRVWRAAWFAAGAVFLLYPVVHLVSIPFAPLEAVLALLAVAIFGTVLARALLIDDGRIGNAGLASTVPVLVLLAVASALTIGWPDAGWSALGYFASVSAGGIVPERRGAALLVLCGVVMGISVVMGGAVPYEGLLTGLSISVIGFTVLALGSLRRTNRALLTARAELAHLAVLEERERIARDLHDTLGHSLSLIALKSELAGRLLPADPDRAGQEIADVEVAAREALASIRETVRGYRRPSLDGELAAMVGALEAAGIDPIVERSPVSVPVAADALLAWAVREGVTNVMRHSQATRCIIRVGADAELVFAEVLDDGVGEDRDRDPAAPGRSASRAGGSGLTGLADRVSGQGGIVTAGALPGRGYRLRVTLPLTTMSTS